MSGQDPVRGGGGPGHQGGDHTGSRHPLSHRPPVHMVRPAVPHLPPQSLMPNINFDRTFLTAQW